MVTFPTTGRLRGTVARYDLEPFHGVLSDGYPVRAMYATDAKSAS